MPAQLKRWNGYVHLNGKQVHVNGAAYSRAELIRLLNQTGEIVSSSYIAAYWSNCWGTAAERNLPSDRCGVWDDAGNVVVEAP